ncbi:sodium:solute symporter family protein [Alicyclobacillus ferrooxydans]|uniref:sodium:solute symporter family protein n=1 Tax=Alicyclobacillus ferrooxydans TaxID=471514 RepID=UPI0006D536A5|nr:hypothetical protein [Alicyclobacillus ferrooxydans]
MWFLGLILSYTLVLLLLSQHSKRKQQSAGQFLDGGRRFGVWNVFLMMTAMWGASMFSVELDTGYVSGLSAIWYGISTIVSSLLVASIWLRPFRKIGYLTNSNLIGRRYGTKARDFAALVIGLTFPIFAMKNVLAAASFLHVMAGWNLATVLIATTVLVIIYVSLGGLWSLAYVQVANLAIFTLGLAVAAYYGLKNHSVMSIPVPHQSQFHGLMGAGVGTILVWFGMNILNSVSAQAEFQTIAAAKDVRKGKLGVYLSSGALLVFAIVPALLGMAAREHVEFTNSGLLAFPVYLRLVAPHWAVVVVGLGFWAAALIWCAPLMFSGASSFGLDFFNRKGLSHNAVAVRNFTRLSMLIQGVFIVVYALARPGQLAWWAVFGLTLRNAAVVGPTISFLLWPAVRERTVFASMILGVASGLGWNAVTDFSATRFALDINPMWVGTGISMLVIIAGTLLENRGNIRLSQERIKRWLGIGFAIVGTVFFALSVFLKHVSLQSLFGADLFLGILFWFFAIMMLTQTGEESVGQVEQTNVAVNA